MQETDSQKERNSLCADNTTITDFETGEMICQNCGVVSQDEISFDTRDDNTFTHITNLSQIDNRTNLRLHDMGLATIIDKSNKDSKGRPIEYKMRYEMRRIRLWDTRSHAKNSSERNLRIALSEMEKLKQKLSLSDANMERSAYLYRKAARSELIQGRSIKGIVGACVYIACREMDASRTIIDISKNLQEPRRSIAKNYRMLFQNFQLVVSVPDTIKCIVKNANNLEIPEKTKREAIRIFDILKERKLTAGKKPDAVAAAVIYIASVKTGVNLSQQKISKVSGISTVTIRNRCQDYIKYVELF